MSEIYKILTNIFLMISHYEEEIEQIRIQLNSKSNFDLIQLYSIIGNNKTITSEKLYHFYIDYSNDKDINKEELINYLNKIIFFYDEDKNGELSYSEFISFVLSQTKYNLRRKIHINNFNTEDNNSISKEIIFLFNSLVEKEIEMIQNLENYERRLYLIKGYNPKLIFNQIKNNNYITPASIIKVLDSQGIKNNNNEIQRIMKRFDINGDCRIELDDFIIIMNFANNDYLNKFNYSNNNNFELFTRDNYNINQRNDFNFENNHHKDFYSFCYSDNRNQFYNIKKNENVYLPILNLRQERIKKCNSMEDILSNKNIKEFGFTRDKKNILDNYINQNDFRKSKLTRHNSLEIPMEKRKKYINNLNISQTEISNKTPLRNYTRNNIVNFKNKTQENQDINQLSSRTKKIIFQGFNNINSINMNNNNIFQNENINNKYNSNLNKLSSIYNIPYNKQQKKIDMSILITGYIKVVISMEFEIEQKKIQLNKRKDFSIKGLYNLFESQTHINKITISSFNRVLTLFGKELSSRELYLFFKRFDNGQKGFLIYDDFFNIFIPFEKRIRDFVIQKNFIPDEISKKTLSKIIEIIECIIEFEVQLEKMRFEMNVSQSDVDEYFNVIDIKRNGFIYYDDLQLYLMKYIDDNIENRIGIDLFFLRLDKNRKDKVFFSEFYDELKYS